MVRRVFVPVLVALVLGISVHQAGVAYSTVPINFTRGTLAGAGFVTASPTTLTLSPDGTKLYVADQNGRIQALTLANGASNTKTITAVQQLTTNTDLQEVYGITFDPADASSIYVTNTVSGFGDVGQADTGTFMGKITKLSGPGFATRTDVITGLPVSNSGHEANGLAFGPDGRLYIAQGSTTNRGVVNPLVGLFQRPEVPTSGAILVANVKAPGFNGNITYSPAATYSDTVDKTGGDVSVFASGLRNPYDIVFHSNGLFYNTDNGPNQDFGPPSTGCASQGVDGPQVNDELNLIVQNAYYGHPNRNRGRTDPRQCIYHPGTEGTNGGYTAPLAMLPASSDGLAEYTSPKFGGQMQSDLLYVSWVANELHRVRLAPDGLTVVSDLILATGFQNPLDVAVAPDGTVYIAEYGGGKITYFRPDESAVSTVSVASITPGAGGIAGGAPVTITGSNFTTTAETTVTIGGAPLTNVVVHNSGMLTGVTPANSVGPKNVVVTNSVGTGTLTDGYTYGDAATPPVANAGPDQSTPIAHIDHAHVTLDGRASYDADNAIIAYEWKEGSTVLSTNSVDSVQLTLGVHDIVLKVTDATLPVPLTGTDNVRIIVTATAENPNPSWCMDINGDLYVNVGDQAIVASVYGKKFGQVGYSRLRDFNGDRIINVGDQAKLAGDVRKYLGMQCPLVDQQIRAATKGMEDAGFENVNNAIAAGYVQVTPFIPGQGRHMLKGAIAGQDLIFNPAQPESLLYEPDASTPGGWRLGGAMYVIPYDLTIPPGQANGIPPDGFVGNEDSWHYHDALCLWNNFQSVAEGVLQSDCMLRSGNPVWVPRAGWLVHLWNFVPNPVGRFVEVSSNFD